VVFLYIYLFIIRIIAPLRCLCTKSGKAYSKQYLDVFTEVICDRSDLQEHRVLVVSNGNFIDKTKKFLTIKVNELHYFSNLF